MLFCCSIVSLYKRYINRASYFSSALGPSQVFVQVRTHAAAAPGVSDVGLDACDAARRNLGGCWLTKGPRR